MNTSPFNTKVILLVGCLFIGFYGDDLQASGAQLENKLEEIRTLFKEQSYDKAYRVAREAALDFSKAPKVWKWLGLLAWEQKKTAAAETAFDNAIALQCNCWEVYRGKGRIFHKRQLWAQAIEMYEHALARHPDDIGLNVEAADLYRAAGRQLSAITYYNKALGLGGERHSITKKLSLCLGEYNEIETSGAQVVASETIRVDVEHKTKGSSRFAVLKDGMYLRTGDKIRIVVDSNGIRTLFLYIFHHGANGKWVTLFPNKQFSALSNPIEETELNIIPDGPYPFELDENIGEERIFIYAGTERNPRLEDLAIDLQDNQLIAQSRGFAGVTEYSLFDTEKIEWFKVIKFRHGN